MPPLLPTYNDAAMPEKTPTESPRIADLKRKLAAEPASRLFLDLAREYYDAGQLQSAADVCARGLKSHPAYLSARVLLGRVYFDMGHTQQSAEAMEAVLAQAPDNLVARRVLAEICMEQGDVGGALDRFRAILAFYPDDAEARRKIEQLEAKLHAAAEEHRPAGEQRPVDEQRPTDGNGAGADPSDSEVLATPTLAEIYLQQGDLEKAEKVYRIILKGDPSNVEAATRLSEIARQAGRPDLAESARQKKIAVLSRWLHAIQGGGPLA